MSQSFAKQVSILAESLGQTDAASKSSRAECLQALAKRLSFPKQHIGAIHDALIFILAYPADEKERRMAQTGLRRLTSFIRKQTSSWRESLSNTGLPFTPINTRFTHDAVRWLLHHDGCKVSLDTFANATLDLNDVLKLTLPALERSETTAGLDNISLLDTLKVPLSDRLKFIVHELGRLDHEPFIKDHLYEGLGVYVKIHPAGAQWSRAQNYLAVDNIYTHQEFVKRVDPMAILHAPLPSHESLTADSKEKIIKVIKNTMFLAVRETDPTTYMDEHSLRFFHLDRGISVAIYTMIPERQLALESYVGYTAFKNGLPVAYGGSWVFGGRANFGINIFPAFRKGESSFVMAQLLRVFIQVFRLTYVEVEPYQFGYDNPEGIASGAFWFYYRFGFRPIDKHLNQLAHKEAEKIKAKPGYRTPPRILRQLATDSVGLKLGEHKQIGVPAITARTTRLIQRKYNGHREKAENICREKFIVSMGLTYPQHKHEDQMLTEAAMWAEAMDVHAATQRNCLAAMIKLRPKDVYSYQEKIREFFSVSEQWKPRSS